MHFVKQKYKLLRKAKSKIENPIHSFRQILCFSSYKNLKVKLLLAGACKRKKRAFFVPLILSEVDLFKHLCIISMYGVLNTLSEYTYFYVSKNITSYKFLLVFKIAEGLQYIRKAQLLLFQK